MKAARRRLRAAAVAAARASIRSMCSICSSEAAGGGAAGRTVRAKERTLYIRFVASHMCTLVQIIFRLFYMCSVFDPLWSRLVLCILYSFAACVTLALSFARGSVQRSNEEARDSKERALREMQRDRRCRGYENEDELPLLLTNNLLLYFLIAFVVTSTSVAKLLAICSRQRAGGSDHVRKCSRCDGQGREVTIQRMGPMVIQQVGGACRECGGSGTCTIAYCVHTRLPIHFFRAISLSCPTILH